MNQYGKRELIVIKARLHHAVIQLQKKLSRCGFGTQPNVDKPIAKIIKYTGSLLGSEISVSESTIHKLYSPSMDSYDKEKNVSSLLVERMAQACPDLSQREIRTLFGNEAPLMLAIIENNMLDLNLNTLLRFSAEDRERMLSDMDDFRLYEYYLANPGTERAVYAAPVSPVDFRDIAEDDSTELLSIDMAFHSGTVFVDPNNRKGILTAILDKGIKTRVLINSLDAMEVIKKNMAGRNARFYPNHSNTIEAWKELAEEYENLSVRMTDILLMHRSYLVTMNAESPKPSIADVRYYTWGNDLNIANPTMVYAQDTDADRYALYRHEFDALWNSADEIR